MICGIVKNTLQIKMKNKTIAGEFWNYLKTRNAWWFSLIIFLLLISSILMISVQGSSLSPFIYALF
jgi:hypothetical protein